jgi:hypothetical protein
MLRKKPRVTVQLVGGLGNQIFQYFAGMYVAIESNSELVLDTSRIGVHGRNHGSTISDFNISERVIFSRWRNLFYRSVFGRFHGFFLRKIPVYSRISKDILNCYQSRTLGYDRSVSNLSPPVTLSGYFQTSQYYNFVIDSGTPKLRISEPSQWYRSMLQMIESKQSLVIHIRRGDYVLLKDTFGLLSKKYYLEAESIIKKRFSFTDIFVFSDDLSIAKEFNLTFSDAVIHYVSPPSESSAAESLMLMSAAKGIILSNSTFAWWSAIIGEIDYVVCPEKWFRDSPIPDGLVQPTWLTTESQWEN